MTKLPYGTGFVDFELPEGAEVVFPNSVQPGETEDEIIAAGIGNPHSTPSLKEIATGRKSAIILIACRTRRTGSQVYVPKLVDELNAAGIGDESITVCTATGTHDNFREEDAPLLIGSAAGRVRIVGHDCETAENLVEVGTTSRGNRVRLSRTYLDAEVKIATGRVNYHYFAGYSGGRKAVLPGVSAKDTILYNHAFAVLRDGDVRLNPEARNGNLATNPIHLDMVEAAGFAPPDFTVSTVCNYENRVTHCFAGDMLQAHAAAAKVVDDLDAPRIDGLADLLVISCGGAPYDVNTIQAIKGLLNSYELVGPGGTVILLAECPEGSPAWLLEACAIQERRELQTRITERRVRQAHNPLWIRGAREHANIIMVTKLPDTDVAALGFTKANSLPEALELAGRKSQKHQRTLVIPYGNMTVPRVDYRGVV